MVKQFLVSSLFPFLGVLAPWRFAPVLAQIDVLNLLMLVVCVFNTVASLILGVVLYKMQQTVNSFNRAEDKSDEAKAAIKAKADAQIKSLSDGLHETATKLIDERFRAMTHQVNNMAQDVIGKIEEIKKRLEDGDGEFAQLSESDHALELKANGRIESLKEWMYENAAMKPDLEKHEQTAAKRFDHLEAGMGQLGQKVAVLADRTRPKGARE